jgi:soluble lytic murein transglycosylase-like protein
MRLPADLLPAMDSLERSYGLPSGILYAIGTWETRGKWRDETSPKGARGIMQLMPVTIAEIERISGVRVDPSKPFQAVTGAAIYLAWLMQRFNRSLPLVLAAYNWGPGNVRRFMRAVAENGTARMPRETAEYIAAVTDILQSESVYG